MSGRSARRVSTSAIAIADERGPGRREQHEHSEAVRRPLVVLGTRRDENGPTRSRPGPDIGERSAIQPHGLAAELGRRIARATARDHVRDLRRCAEHTPAERGRACHDASPAIDDLDQQAAPAHAALERAGGRQERRSRRAELSDLGRPRAQRRIAG